MLKTSFDKVWELEPELLNETCSYKFRNNYNVSIYLVRYYQLVNGLFEPRSNKFGHYFSLKNYKDVINAINNQKYKCICLNDDIDDDFELIKDEVNKTFESKFPIKSSFER